MIEGAISGFTGMVTTIIAWPRPVLPMYFPEKACSGSRSDRSPRPNPRGYRFNSSSRSLESCFWAKACFLSGRLLLLDLLSGDFRTVTVRNMTLIALSAAKIPSPHQVTHTKTVRYSFRQNRLPNKPKSFEHT
jgi:hypothetical protein